MSSFTSRAVARRCRAGALALVAALPQCSYAATETISAEEAAVLDVVVDSLPFAIGQTWGATDVDTPTTLLSSAAPTSRVLDEPGESGEDDAPPRHTSEWLARQVAKEHVVGTCALEPDGEYCDYDRASVVATVSRARFYPDGRATVELAIGRRDFGSISEVVLERTSGAWAVVDFNVIVIS